MSLNLRIFSRTQLTYLTFLILLSAPLVSCVSKTPLGSETDDTPPVLSVTVNGQQLEDEENVNKFENIHISKIIRIHGTAKDEQSGVRDIAVGANLKLQCGVSKEIMYHATADRPEWEPDVTYTGNEVAKEHTTTHNFRMWYLQQKCGELPLIEAEGDIFVTARNYFGRTSTQTYKVKFTPSSWR